MKLISLTCDNPSFKNIFFRESGISIILGDGEKEVDGTSNGVGTTLTYAHTKARTKGITLIPIVGLFAGGVNAEVTSVILRFDNKDILTSYETTTSEQDVSTGIIAD